MHVRWFRQRLHNDDASYKTLHGAAAFLFNLLDNRLTIYIGAESTPPKHTNLGAWGLVNFETGEFVSVWKANLIKALNLPWGNALLREGWG